MPRGLDELFRDAVQRYPSARRSEKFGHASAFWPIIAEIKEALHAVPSLAASNRTRVKVSFGQGGWAEVPNFAIMDARETERPSSGVYIVYLLRADASGLVLSLNQGSADLIFEAKGRALSVLTARAERVREALNLDVLGSAGFNGDPVDLKSVGQYPRAYVAGSIVAKTYLAGAMPSEAELRTDLELLHAAYQTVIPSARLLAEVGRRPPEIRSRY
jgi:hypothetical protein